MSLLKKIIRIFISTFYPLFKPLLRLLVGTSHSVKIAIFYQDKILLIKNSYRKGWTLPGGGIKKNETSEKAAVREAYEEVGINLTDMQNHGKTKLNFGKNNYVTIFSSRISSSEFKIDELEVEKAEWVELKNLSKIELLPVANHCIQFLNLNS